MYTLESGKKLRQATCYHCVMLHVMLNVATFAPISLQQDASLALSTCCNSSTYEVRATCAEPSGPQPHEATWCLVRLDKQEGSMPQHTPFRGALQHQEAPVTYRSSKTPHAKPPVPDSKASTTTKGKCLPLRALAIAVLLAFSTGIASG